MAGWAEAAAFTRERDQVLLDARIALHAREAAAEQSAVEVAVELALHEWRQRRALEARCDGGIQRLDVVGDYRVERGRLRPAALVTTDGRVERNCRKPHRGGVGRAACRASGPLHAAKAGRNDPVSAGARGGWARPLSPGRGQNKAYCR